MTTIPTYDLISTTTLAATSSSITFGSLPQNYGDLILIIGNAKTSSSAFYAGLRFNSDSGNNYSFIYIYGDGNDAYTGASNADSSVPLSLFYSSIGQASVDIFDYSATNKQKTSLVSVAAENITTYGTRWANTAAITSLEVFASSSSFAVGSTFSLYGVIK